MDFKVILDNTKNSALIGFNNYANFDGRANRPDFWYWFLFIVGTTVILQILGQIIPIFYAVAGLFSLATFLPSIAFGARRLHDVNQTGWWQLILVVPLLGLAAMIYWWCQPSVNDNNKF